MDFDDLDDAEAEQGPTPEERRVELLKTAKPESKPFPVAKGRCFGKRGKMKLLWLHGACSNAKLSALQIPNVLAAWPEWRDHIEYEVWEGPIRVGLDFLGGGEEDNPMKDSLKPFGPDYFVYYNHDDDETLGAHADVLGKHGQCENHIGIDETLEQLAAYLKDHGPFDGWFGFDSGAHTLHEAARRAQEGDPAFAGMTRFLMLFTSLTTRLLSPIAHVRPKVPLQLPTLISWCGDDPVMPTPIFEETALFIDEAHREVARHGQGHQPPKFDSKVEGKLGPRVKDFLSRMAAGQAAEPSLEASDNAEFSGLWLPIARVTAPVRPAKAKKRLLVVPDLHLGADVRKLVETAEALPNEAVQQFKLKADMFLEVAGLRASDFAAGIDIDVEEMGFTAEHKKDFLFDAPNTASVNTWDVLSDSKIPLAKSIADEILEGFSVQPEDWIGIVGIGSGAIVALLMVKQLMFTRRLVPAGFWAINPPTIFPRDLFADGPGALLDCPVFYLVHELSRAGAPWRWEIMTIGPFAQVLFKDRSQAAKLVVDSCTEL